MSFLPRHPSVPLFLSALLTLSTAACLVTEALEEQEALPPAENWAPRIVEETVAPRNGAVLAPQDCAIHLSIGAIEERDLADELTARWFIDGVLRASQRLPVQSDEVLRPGPNFTFKVASHTPGMHVVLVAISDGFADGEELRSALEGRSVVSYEWSIDTSAATSACFDVSAAPVVQEQSQDQDQDDER
ncbi:MAG: hypothetical protein LBM75_11955 [Myxococcales bacterium]|jgi:hypothetical protein|nr:hypothetical protein [Myxococcales bacterium]